MSTYVYRHYEVKVKDLNGKYEKLSDIPESEIVNGNYFSVWGEKESHYWCVKDNHFTPCEYNDIPRKWVMAKWWKPCKYSYDHENSFKIGDIDAVESYYYEDNGGAIRDNFLSTYWGEDYGLTGRGWPSDMSKELSERLKPIKDEDYIHSETYVTLKEWNDLYDKMFEKFKLKFTNIVTENNISNINDRFDYIENLIKFYSNKCNSQDLDMTKKWEKKKDEEDEEEYYEDTFEGKLSYLFDEEEYYYLMSIKNEMNRAYFITNEIFGWEDESNIRIVYYMG